jgi:hypothetical protein
MVQRESKQYRGSAALGLLNGADDKVVDQSPEEKAGEVCSSRLLLLATCGEV